MVVPFSRCDGCCVCCTSILLLCFSSDLPQSVLRGLVVSNQGLDRLPPFRAINLAQIIYRRPLLAGYTLSFLSRQQKILFISKLVRNLSPFGHDALEMSRFRKDVLTQHRYSTGALMENLA